MLRVVTILFVIFNVSVCQNFLDLDLERNRFFAAAKNFLWCKFCQKFQRKNSIEVEQSLKMLMELNEAFGKDPFDGIPIHLQPTANPSSKIAEIFNHKENALRRFAIGKMKETAIILNNEEIEKFCSSLKCVGFD